MEIKAGDIVAIKRTFDHEDLTVIKNQECRVLNAFSDIGEFNIKPKSVLNGELTEQVIRLNEDHVFAAETVEVINEFEERFNIGGSVVATEETRQFNVGDTGEIINKYESDFEGRYEVHNDRTGVTELIDADVMAQSFEQAYTGDPLKIGTIVEVKPPQTGEWTKAVVVSSDDTGFSAMMRRDLGGMPIGMAVLSYNETDKWRKSEED